MDSDTKPRPNFFIIGAPKAATTSLSSLLATHPQAGIAKNKEPHYFSVNHRVGVENYLSLFDHCAGKQAIGDASTSYCRIRYHPLALERMREFAPHAKIIYMVRHPLERIESAFGERLLTPNNTVPAEIDKAVLQVPMLVDSSRYWEVFSAVSEMFGEDRVKIVWFEEYVRFQAAIFADVCRFLEIDASIPPKVSVERRNSREEHAKHLPAAGRSASIPICQSLSEEVRTWILSQLERDNCRFLDHFSRPRNYWTNCY